MKIIPAIDLLAGRVVRLAQGDFARTREFADDAPTLASRYLESGADWLHVVDLDGARGGQLAQSDLLARIAATGARVQAGGGVRTREHVERLFSCGVARVVVGSVAVREPDTFVAWLDEFGAAHFCMALDLRCGEDGRWRPAVDAWQRDSEADADVLLRRFADAGLRHMLCTDIAQDGMRNGPNVPLYRDLVSRWPEFEWIASGGVRDAHDVRMLRTAGVAACVAGSALLDGTLPLHEIMSCSRAA